MAASLHEDLLAELDRREAYPRIVDGERWGTAEEDDGGHCVRILSDDHEEDGWIVASDITGDAADHIALHDPADALRRYAADRERLEEHEPCEPGECMEEHGGTTMCHACDRPAEKCREAKRVARSLGIEVQA